MIRRNFLQWLCVIPAALLSLRRQRATHHNVPSVEYYRQGIAGEDVRLGDAVTLGRDGKYYRAGKPSISHDEVVTCKATDSNRILTSSV